ncbi:sporulation protein [Actinosynnema sp. CA-248983]
MKVRELAAAARDAVSVRRVYGEPYEKDGVTVIPAAAVGGGGGGGSGTDERGQVGEGGGIGVSGRPVGAYVIRGGQVGWHPAVDVNRLVSSVAVVLVAFLVARVRIARARAAREPLA